MKENAILLARGRDRSVWTWQLLDVRQQLRSVALSLLVIVVVYLIWVASTITVEYHDGYEYIVTGWTVAGATKFFFPKNVVLSSWFALLLLWHRVIGAEPTLATTHLAMLVLHAGCIAIIARWIKALCPPLPLAVIAVVVVSNRLVIHYAPFALADLAGAGAIGLWYWVDLRLPHATSRGMASRAVVVALCVLVRQHIVLIPIVNLAYQALHARRWREFLSIGFGSLFLFVIAMVFFFRLGAHADSARALRLAIASIRSYAIQPTLDPGYHPPWVYAVNLYLLLTPIGVVLAALGSAELYRHGNADARRAVVNAVFGSAVVLTYLITVSSKDARYTSPFLPLWACLQCFGLVWFLRSRPAFGVVALLALFAAVTPELWHFTQGFYRRDAQRTTATTIARWSVSTEARFLTPMGTFFPPRHYFHWNDGAFYVYHFGVAGYVFHTLHSADNVDRRVTFTRYGYPFPDAIDSLAPPGVTMIVPGPKPYETSELPERMPLVHALRWWPRSETLERNCVTHIPELCVERVIAFDGGATDSR